MRVLAPTSPAFTLIEMMVVLTIVMIITATVLVSSNQFNGSILLRSLASQIGLSIREAQLYGVSVKQVSGASADQAFNTVYGVYFGAAAAPSGGSYSVFADNDNNQQDNGTSEDVEIFHIPKGFSISSVCVAKSSGGSYCPPISTTGWLSIMFKRPDPNAHFYTDADSSDATYSGATIVVKSPSGATRTVSISSTGLIAIPQTTGS